MATDNNGEYNGKPDIELETITNNPNMIVSDCCRENWDNCPHKLGETPKIEYNPV